MSRTEKWDRRFLELCKHISDWSHDPSTKVGSVIVDDKNRIISLGYNGFAVGVTDTEERLNNREIKYRLAIHAERNALLFANRSLDGCVLYVWPLPPCSVCASMIIQSGIKRVVSVSSDNPRWIEDSKLAEEIFREAKVDLIHRNI